MTQYLVRMKKKSSIDLQELPVQHALINYSNMRVWFGNRSRSQVQNWRDGRGRWYTVGAHWLVLMYPCDRPTGRRALDEHVRETPVVHRRTKETPFTVRRHVREREMLVNLKVRRGELDFGGVDGFTVGRVGWAPIFLRLHDFSQKLWMILHYNLFDGNECYMTHSKTSISTESPQEPDRDEKHGE